MLPDGAPCCSSFSARALSSHGLAVPRRHGRPAVRTCTPRAQAGEGPRRRKESQLGRGKRRFSKIADKQTSNPKHQKELDEMKRLIPDRLSDPLLNVGDGLDPYALTTGKAQPETGGGQASLLRVENVSLTQWEDALTVGELKEKYGREHWLKTAEAEAISLHHEQRSRGTVPSYGQALAMATLMEEMHLGEDGYDPYRLPYWIRATFIMEERWGELEAEFHATQDAVQLAEEWGVTEELQDKIDRMDPELFVGEPDGPAEPDLIDGLLEGTLPGTAGFQGDTSIQMDFMRDILPEGGDDDIPDSNAPQNGEGPPHRTRE